MSIPLFKQNKMTFKISDNLKTNLDVGYWANVIKYFKIGNLVICELLLNTKEVSDVTDDFYIEVPFTFDSHWFSAPIKASPLTNYSIKCVPGTNKINLLKGNVSILKANEVDTGFIIHTQFFAFIQ